MIVVWMSSMDSWKWCVGDDLRTIRGRCRIDFLSVVAEDKNCDFRPRSMELIEAKYYYIANVVNIHDLL